jgi:hypothetical protein
MSEAAPQAPGAGTAPEGFGCPHPNQQSDTNAT